MNPSWIVQLEQRRSTELKRLKEDKFVRSATRQGAIACALRHSFLSHPTVIDARIATPAELGCVPTPPKGVAP